MKNNLTKDEMLRCVEKIHSMLVEANTNLTIYKKLCELCAKGKQYQSVIEEVAPNYWKFTIDNLEDSLITTLSKIYDTRHDSVNVKKLIEICSENHD